MTGDLFSCPPDQALAHCISQDCHMGAGIAVLFKDKFKGVGELKHQNKQPGQCAVLTRDGRFIYYLVTKTQASQKPTYENLRNSLEDLKSHCLHNQVTKISMPRIGCGLDRLQWDKVADILEQLFKQTDITITVYSLPKKQEDSGEPEDEVVDICAALLNRSDNIDLPFRRIMFNGQTYDCLCDTGACRTVLTSPPPGLIFSQDPVFVKTASGHLKRHLLSTPVHISDCETCTRTTCCILIDSSCPVNLLGRDLMVKLGISVVPSKDGMTTIVQDSPENQCVILGPEEPTYYWSLDLPPGYVPRELMATARKYSKVPGVDFMSPDELHVTMKYNYRLGPDKNYETKLLRMEDTSITIKHLYISPEGQMVCSVILTPEQRKLQQVSLPHLSVAKLREDTWFSLSKVLRKAETDDYTQKPRDPFCYGKHHGFRRLYLGWKVKTKPSTHLAENMPE